MSGPLGPDELAQVPAKRGVFLLEGPGGEAVLLATAASIRSRMRYKLAAPDADTKASRRIDLREVASCLRWRLTTSHFEMDWQWLELARLIHPGTYRKMLSFAPAWFVHVRTADAFATFHKVRQVPATGACFGPFPTSRACGRFIEILQDVFNLCRCEQLFAGGGAGCMYAQMGKCIAPCRDADPERVYRDVVARACRCAAGDRETVAGELADDMRRLAADREYERAGRCKARLERLAELDEPAFAHARPAEEFRYILVQPGAGRRKLKAFLVDRGAIRARSLEYPLVGRQLTSVMSAMAKFCAADRSIGQAEQERIALVSGLLFTSPARRGVVVRYGPSLTAENLAEQIEARAGSLNVARRAVKKKGGSCRSK